MDMLKYIQDNFSFVDYVKMTSAMLGEYDPWVYKYCSESPLKFKLEYNFTWNPKFVFSEATVVGVEESTNLNDSNVTITPIVFKDVKMNIDLEAPIIVDSFLIFPFIREFNGTLSKKPALEHNFAKIYSKIKDQNAINSIYNHKNFPYYFMIAEL